MELQAVWLNGFRRFAEETELKTHGKLVAILGPNEAGKTSLLNAITYLSNRDPIPKSDYNRHMTIGDEHVIISARFRLDQDDLAAARLDKPTWCTLQRKVSGKRNLIFDPPVPTRDISNRKKIVSVIQKIKSNNKIWGRLVDRDEAVIQIFDSALNSLNSNDETLGEDFISSIQNCLDYIDPCIVETDPLYFQNLPYNIEIHLNFEKEKTPVRFAADAIYSKIPRVLFFSNEDRLLKGSYSLEELSEKILPTALENLCKVAKINLKDFIDAIREDDTPTIARMKSQANDELKDQSKNWSQSDVHVSLDVTNEEIHVLVREENYHFTRLAERSDGLRQFVALQIFTTCERAENPILLIDEAEMRLHYDAQADLIQILSKQNVSSKIIYTTHSAGCLPEDLGYGVRLVSGTTDSGGNASSEVKNYFWNRTEGGLDPLLFGMGAATLAFFPIRKALLTEGESDMLLIPTLFREALEVSSLKFQVVPGLSKTSGINLPILSRNGKGIAFALDYDGGGRSIEAKIVKAGFDKESIFFMEGPTSADVQLEDFVSVKALAFAVNETSRELGSKKVPIVASAFRATGRLDLIAKHFGLRKAGDVPKTMIAYHVLDYHISNPDEPLIDSGKRTAFIAFAQKVSRYLEKESEKTSTST